MITGSLKNTIDKLWLEFHTGGITNPLTVIEQISFLMFARMLDLREQRAEKRAQRTGKKDFDPIFPPEKQHLRWSHLVHLGAEAQLDLLQQELFPWFRDKQNGLPAKVEIARYLEGAQCLVQKPSLLKSAINTLNELPLHEGDTKGDLYEYLLSKLTTAGVAGQFRTPRHIIRAMVEMLDVQPDQTVCDPACGTGGFLIETMEHLRRTHTSKELIHDQLDDSGQPILDAHGKPVKVFEGDQLDPYRKHIEEHMFHGFDFDSTMLRIAAMNMLLHGIDAPCIEYQDTLADTFAQRFPEHHEGAFDVVLANPPFKGSIDADSVHKSLTAVAKTSKTELLFLVLLLRMLKRGGKCAVIVPDGVLFGSSSAHQAVRRMIIEEHQLDAVVSLPSGVFKPYAGVSTAILLFTRGGRTENVWFYKVANDGYSLDDKRDPIPGSDLTDLVDQWKKWSTPKKQPVAKFEDRTAKCFVVPKDEIVGQKFDLSFNRYFVQAHEEQTFESPQVILDKLRTLENEILADLNELEDLLR
jgi:type I restriction enzyme M protein